MLTSVITVLPNKSSPNQEQAEQSFFHIAVNRRVRERDTIFCKHLLSSLTLPHSVGRFTAALVLLTLGMRSRMLPVYILLLLRLDFAAATQLNPGR